MVSTPTFKILMMHSNKELIKGIGCFVGGPLSLTPIIKVLDASESPVKGKKITSSFLIGKKVVAFSWPEPIMNSKDISNELIDAYKYVYFNNSVSLPTDEKGITSFPNLTVT